MPSKKSDLLNENPPDAHADAEAVARATFSLPLNALRVINAVGRRGSLRGAADELGVVPNAVRQQLQGLEDHLGTSLSARVGGRVILNPSGRRLADAVAIAFGIIGRAADEISGRDASSVVRIGAPSAFATSWLMPHLSDFNDRHPRITLDVIPVDVNLTLADRPDLDALVVGGEYRPLPDVDALSFMPDRFGLVGTAVEADKLLRVGGNGGVASTALIVARNVPDLADDWFRESAVSPLRFARRIEVETLELALAAARAGMGVTTAPELAVSLDIVERRLSAPMGFASRPVGYRLCCRKNERDGKALVKLRDWLAQVSPR